VDRDDIVRRHAASCWGRYRRVALVKHHTAHDLVAFLIEREASCA
jgi:hypothetical protein